MKSYNFIIIIFCCLFTICCSKDDKSPMGDGKDKIISSTDSLTLGSIFLWLGCCQDESKRVKPCCCEAILKEYATLYEQHAETNPLKISNLSTTDPLLGNCKKIMRTAFESIDNPPPKDSTDNFDDLF